MTSNQVIRERGGCSVDENGGKSCGQKDEVLKITAHGGFCDTGILEKMRFATLIEVLGVGGAFLAGTREVYIPRFHLYRGH